MEIKFDSKKEMARYIELYLLEKGKAISGLTCQHRIPLTCGGRPVKSKKGRQLAYFVDFTYWDNGKKRQCYEDVKGYHTPLGDLKIAVVEAEQGIHIDLI